MSTVPSVRLRTLGDRPLRPGRDLVLYWMVAYRRLDWNFALQHAVEYARELDRPLLILEGLRIDYPWASHRHHRFVLDGMKEHRDRLSGGRVAYHPYVEPEPGAGRGLLEALGERACVVVTDDYPTFFLPRMQAAAARKLDVRLECVDSNGLHPIRSVDRDFTAAYPFRRHLQKTLPEHLTALPAEHPLTGDPLRPARVPDEILERWPAASESLLAGEDGALEGLPLDDTVPPVPFRGGTSAARSRLERFLEDRLDRYGEERNDPDAGAASRLSPYLHWGHLAAHEVFVAVARREGWSPARISGASDGKRSGWWGMSASAEAFLDELVTWRELGFAFCAVRDDHTEYASLPDWARETLAEHAGDTREWVYDRDDFERARTHDELWNAAQRELRAEGTIHNYLRMLWGKKILEWSPDPRTALEIMIELNNRWSIDGRDPNSWSGIFWCLGRFDRGWPERDVYGKVRSMSSDSTRRKVSVDGYLRRFGDHGDLFA